MKPAAQTTFAERLGHLLGRLWRGYARADRQATQRLISKGLPPPTARALVLIIELAAFCVLFYTTFWIALMLGFALAGAWIIRNDDGSYDEEHAPQWEHGHAGYGLYSHEGHRIDLHDPEDEQS